MINGFNFIKHKVVLKVVRPFFPKSCTNLKAIAFTFWQGHAKLQPLNPISTSLGVIEYYCNCQKSRQFLAISCIILG